MLLKSVLNFPKIDDFHTFFSEISGIFRIFRIFRGKNSRIFPDFPENFPAKNLQKWAVSLRAYKKNRKKTRRFFDGFSGDFRGFSPDFPSKFFEKTRNLTIFHCFLRVCALWYRA